MTRSSRKGAAASDFIADKVVWGLEKGLEVFFKGLATFFGIDGLPTDLGKALDRVQDAVDTPIEKVVEVVAGPAAALVGKFTEKVEEAEHPNMIGTPYVEPDGKAAAWVESEGTDGYAVYVSMSEPVKVGTKEDAKEMVAAIKEEQAALTKVKSLTPAKGSKGKKKSPGLKAAMRELAAARKRKKAIAEKLVQYRKNAAELNKKPAAGKYRGGRYKDVSGLNPIHLGDKLDANHMPAQASYKDLQILAYGNKILSPIDGPAIQMEQNPPPPHHRAVIHENQICYHLKRSV